MTTYTTTDQINNQSSILRGNVAIIGGIWSAMPTSTAVPITTGGTKVLAAGVTLDVSPFSTSAAPPKVDYDLTNGVLTITPAYTPNVNTNGEGGQWWAIVQIADVSAT